MLKNYLKIAFRTIRQHKIFSSINIFGLSLGVICCLLIGLYISYELSYDDHFEHADRIHRIAWWSENPQTRTPHPMARAMVRDFPEVEAATSLSPIWGPGLTRPIFSVRYQDKRFDEKGFFSADSTFFDLFSFELIKGDKKTALTQPGGIVITEEMAQKYFDGQDPIGKTLRVNDQFNLAVTGVMENIPQNTHFHFDFLISYVTMKQNSSDSSEYYTWADFGHYNYIKLSAGANADQLEEKMVDWSGQYIDWSESTRRELQQGSIGFRLQPITDIHLYSDIRWELEPNGNIAYIYIFSGAALFILIIASINFMNLTTAQSLIRSKEVGLRKTAGASRKQLIGQFLVESILIAAVSVILALGIVDYLLPWFNEFAGIESSLMLSDWKFWVGTLSAILLLGIVSGSYPAFFLSRFKPTQVLKGKFTTSQEGVPLRKALVVLQFSVSIILITGTIVIYQQLNYLEQKDLGFSKEQIAVVPIKGDHVRDRYEALKDRLSNLSGVRQVTAVSNYPGGTFNQQQIQWKADGPRHNVAELRADYDFSETLDIEVIEGRGFSKEYADGQEKTFLLNKAAARQFDWENPIGKEISYFDDETTHKGKVVGIVEDFHFQSLHQTVSPLIVQVMPEEFNYVLIKLQPNNISQQLASIEEIWSDFDPLFSFDYSFLDSEFEANYRKEQRAGSILFLFAGLAILIASLGLFGLISFATQQRIKEIGVRKVLGASAFSIVELFSKDYLKLVLVGFLIAVPIAWYIINQWLNNFAYKVEVGLDIFVWAGFIALVIAVTTVGWQSLRAARMNPIKNLRSE